MNENNDKMDRLIELQKESLIQLSKINKNICDVWFLQGLGLLIVVLYIATVVYTIITS